MNEELCPICQIPNSGPLLKIVRMRHLFKPEMDGQLKLCRYCFSAFRLRSLSDERLDSLFLKVDLDSVLKDH